MATPLIETINCIKSSFLQLQLAIIALLNIQICRIYMNCDATQNNVFLFFVTLSILTFHPTKQQDARHPKAKCNHANTLLAKH